MHVYVRRGLEAPLLVGKGILLCAGTASADEGTTGADSVLGGNQVTAPTLAASAVPSLATPGLARTGADVGSMVLLALMLLLAGGASTRKAKEVTITG